MDLERIRRCWRDDRGTWPERLEEGPVIEMLTNRATDLRREVGRRLRREAGYYVPMVAVAVAGLIGGVTFNRVLAACGLGLILGAIPATLWWAERRIANAPLDHSLLRVLSDLRSRVDAASRAYAAAYVAVFVVTAVLLIGVVWWRSGAGFLFAGTVATGVLAVMWSVRSGRAYVERMFRRHMVELNECLRQLEEQA
jgi:hypothetical protein